MLTNLFLRNFKSWPEPGVIRLAPITVFFGANSSGKTSLLQSLLLLKQTVESTDRNVPLNLGDKTSPINLGDFQSIVHQHDPSAEVELSFQWRPDKHLRIADPTRPNITLLESGDLGFKTVVRASGTHGKAFRMTVPSMEYRVGEAVFGMRRKDEKKEEYDLFDEQSPLHFIRTQGRAWPLPAPSKCYGFPDQVRAYFQNAGFLSDLELAFEEQLMRVFYLGPLRAYPERTYFWSGSQPSDMGRAGEQAIEAILASRDRGETISQGKGRGRKRMSLEEYVAYWLKELGLIYEFRVDAASEGSQIFTVKVKKTPKSAEVLITDVGFGVSQILPVIVLCFYAPPGSTIILEQPEIHLHPAVQAKLADVIVDACRKRHVQVVVESHSEHLLRRLQRRMAEGQLNESEVALYFCETVGLASGIVPLQLDGYGNIANWPRDFFGDQMGEVAETQLARLTRMQEVAA